MKTVKLHNESNLSRRVKTLINKLNDYYPEFTPKKLRDPLDELVLTILSQNTNDNNSFAGFQLLKKQYPKWEDVVAAPSQDIEKTIAVAGLAKTKTRYIVNVLKAIGEENKKTGRLKRKSIYHLEHVKKMELEDAIAYLTSFKGVGQKTAACVLAFSCKMDSFPIDTHVHRILKRLDIIPENMSAENAHEVMYRITKPEDRYRFHVNLIHYGREVCHARKPECKGCTLKRGCKFVQP